MKQAAITINNLTVSYRNLLALNNISMEVPQGVLLAIVGPNGAGKTTLLKSIVGLVTPLAGTIELFGSAKKVKELNIAYLPQRSTIDWDFPVTALDAVLMGTYRKLGWFRRPGKVETDHAIHMLEQVGLVEYAHRPINELSGGQQQRVFLARALCQEAQLYIMDEPFVGIDFNTERILVNLLQKLKQEGKTIILVHHDLHTLTTYFDWAFMLNVKAIACGPVDQVLTNEHLLNTYGKKMSFNQVNL